MSEESKKGNKPVKKFKAGSIEVAVWEQTSDKGTFYTVSEHRSYLKKDGDPKKSEDWAKTNSYRVNDLPVLGLLLAKAFEFCKLKNEEGD